MGGKKHTDAPDGGGLGVDLSRGHDDGGWLESVRGRGRGRGRRVGYVLLSGPAVLHLRGVLEALALDGKEVQIRWMSLGKRVGLFGSGSGQLSHWGL